MDQTLTPDWVKSLGEQRERDIDRQQMRRLQADAASRSIRSDGPRFWRQFEREVALVIEGCKSIPGIRGASKIDIGQPDFKNLGFRVILLATPPMSIELDFRYREGDDTIQCYTPTERRMLLVVDEQNEVGLFCGQSSRGLSPEDAAKELLLPFIKRVLS